MKGNYVIQRVATLWNALAHRAIDLAITLRQRLIDILMLGESRHVGIEGKGDVVRDRMYLNGR